MRVAYRLTLPEDVPDCDALYEAAEVIQQLITEHCPIARPATKRAKK